MSVPAAGRPLIARDLGEQPYVPTWQAMQAFTDERDGNTADELWFTSHPPVFTQGRNGKAEHLLNPGHIPVVAVDRGGQVTYHGPGQLMGYLLLDIRRHGTGVRELVTAIELTIVDLLAHLGVNAQARADAPGVYVAEAKIAALGLRIRRGCSFHGFSLNVDLDLSPFERINPCGYQGLSVTRMRDLGVTTDRGVITQKLYEGLCSRLGYTAAPEILMR